MHIETASHFLEKNHYLHVPSIPALSVYDENHHKRFKAHWNGLSLDQNYKNYTWRERSILKYDYTHPDKFVIDFDNIFHPEVTNDTNEIDYEQGVNDLTYATNDFINDAMLASIIEFDLALIPFFLSQGKNYRINVSQFRVKSVQGRESPTTSGPHKDGYDYIFMHLVNHQNIVPPASRLFQNHTRESQFFQHTLKNYMESLVVNDRALYHSADHVLQKQADEPGYRDMLIIDVQRQP